MNMTIGATLKPGERGQTMVELAIILPLFLILVFGIIEIGRAWGTQQSLTRAAREGARILVMPYGAGLTYASEEAVKLAAEAAVRTSLNESGVWAAPATIALVRVTPGDNKIYDHIFPNDDQVDTAYTNGKRGDRVGVHIGYAFETAAPILLQMFNSGGGSSTQGVINMGATCYMVHE